MATVTIKYSPLLTASVMQLYYTNQICPAYQSAPILDFDIVPTAECLDYMKSRSMIFKNIDSAGGFLVMAATTGTNGSGNYILRKPVAVGDKLSFMMVLRNANLLNFDVLPPNLSAGSIYYFSNQVKDNAAKKAALHLTKAAAGVDGNNDQIKKATTYYSYSYAGVISVADAKVKHLLTGKIINAKSVIVDNTKSDVSFDLSGLPSGCCQLLIGTTVTDNFYYLGTMADQPVFGVIELSLSTALGTNYRVVEADQTLTAVRPNYTVLFKNRPTIWRYTVQLQPNSPMYLEMAKLSAADRTEYIKELNILVNDAGIKFKLASSTDTSFVFVSIANIPLKEKYNSSTSATPTPLILTLTKYTKTSGKTAPVKTNLPYPSVTVIDAGSLPTIYSDVFISL